MGLKHLGGSEILQAFTPLQPFHASVAQNKHPDLHSVQQLPILAFPEAQLPVSATHLAMKAGTLSVSATMREVIRSLQSYLDIKIHLP